MMAAHQSELMVVTSSHIDDVAVSRRVLNTLEMIGRFKGLFVGPRPDWQGKTWSVEEIEQLHACCDISLLPKEYNGRIIVLDADRLAVMGTDQMPFYLTHRYVLNDRGWRLIAASGRA